MIIIIDLKWGNNFDLIEKGLLAYVGQQILIISDFFVIIGVIQGFKI